MYGPCLNSHLGKKKKVRYTYREHWRFGEFKKPLLSLRWDNNIVLVLYLKRCCCFIFKSLYRKMLKYLQKKYCDV